MLDFNNKIFVCTAYTSKNNVDVTTETTFYYKQFGKIVRATYSGGNIVKGVLIGMVNEQGILEVSFNHLSTDSQFHGGTCTFIPEKRMDTGYLIHGLWILAEENTIKNELILEELH